MARRSASDIWKSRFLDLRTLVGAEFGKPLSLKAACELKAFEKFDLPQKGDYTHSGQVTVREIEEGRQNVRCNGSSAQCHDARVRLTSDQPSSYGIFTRVFREGILR